MKAGIGSAAIKLPNGLVVAAIVAVNAVGDIIDPWTGQVVAGARGADGKLLDARKLLRGGSGRWPQTDTRARFRRSTRRATATRSSRPPPARGTARPTTG